jgi:hypothetical protein
MPSEFAAFSSTCPSFCDTGTGGVVHRALPVLDPRPLDESQEMSKPSANSPTTHSLSAAEQATAHPLCLISQSDFVLAKKSRTKAT